jgi:hypothetical protein
VNGIDDSAEAPLALSIAHAAYILCFGEADFKIDPSMGAAAG